MARETDVEKVHGKCADLLMSDYGIPKEKRIEVCTEISKYWHHSSRFHDIIVHTVRGYLIDSSLDPLKAYLEKIKTHDQLNKNTFMEPKRLVGLDALAETANIFR